MRKPVRVTLTSALLFSLLACEDQYTRHCKDETRQLVEAGVSIVKWTTFDKLPQKGNSSTGHGMMYDCKPEIEIGLGRNRDPYDPGEWTLLIHNSNKQLSEFLSLKRGDTVSFEYSAAPVQDKCACGMFLKLKHIDRKR